MPATRRHLLTGLAAIPLLPRPGLAQAGPAAAHGISMYGDLAYPAGFTHFRYARPDAPKGGAFVQEGIGSFDSLNPFVLRGTTAAGTTLPFDTLVARSLDEPFSAYGLLAQAIVLPDDRAWVAFDLHPDARFHDGRPVTVDDVLFSFKALTTEGHPRYRYYYADVAEVVASGARQVTFRFKPGVNRELAIIVGDIPILPKHWWAGRNFADVLLDPPLGSGPYRIGDVEPGRTITLERVTDYWAAELPVNKGRNNVDRLRYEYYRDRDVSLEAFKAGRYDFRQENSAKRWNTGYTGRAVERGLVKTEKLAIAPPARMQGFTFNLRRPLFEDRRVREALGYAFDFEWSNKTLFFGQYERIRSYFHGEPSLMATGTPEGAELALLEPFRDRLPPELFTAAYEPPVTDGSGNIRDNLRQGFKLLKAAGWEVKDKVLTGPQGQPMRFEILLGAPDLERITTPFVQNLARLGVQASIRTVDPAQYQNRTDAFDFDVTTDIWAESNSPGNEQRGYWGSAAADTPGSRNTLGIKDPIIDALIEKVVQAETRESLEVATRALDRVLLWGFYQVPHFTNTTTWVAYWDKFGRPEQLPSEALDTLTWWVEPARAGATEAALPEVTTPSPP